MTAYLQEFFSFTYGNREVLSTESVAAKPANSRTFAQTLYCIAAGSAMFVPIRNSISGSFSAVW